MDYLPEMCYSPQPSVSARQKYVIGARLNYSNNRFVAFSRHYLGCFIVEDAEHLYYHAIATKGLNLVFSFNELRLLLHTPLVWRRYSKDGSDLQKRPLVVLISFYLLASRL